jgi:hypothetical protein
MAFGVGPSAYASHELSMFDDLLAAISRKLALSDLFQQLTAVICQVVPYDEAHLILLGEDGPPFLYARTPDSASKESPGMGQRRFSTASSRRCSMSCPDRTGACSPA